MRGNGTDSVRQICEARADVDRNGLRSEGGGEITRRALSLFTLQILDRGWTPGVPLHS